MQVPPHYKQYNPNVSFTENLPPPPVITTAAHQPQTISGNPNYTQQQQIYIQQQQIYAQQQQQYQTLRRKQQQAQQQAHAQAQAQGQLPPPQQIYQPNPNQQNQLPPPPQVTQIAMQQQQPPPQMQQQQQQQQPQIPPHTQQQYVTSSAVNYTPAPPSATMAVVTANNATYVQSAQPPPPVDGMIYEQRDKQIYKCSTLGRYGGKYDGQRQQNLVPAVIPTVPQIPKYNNGQPQVTSGAATIPTQMMANTQMANSGGMRPAIQNCPLPDIPSVGTFKGGVVANDKVMVSNDLPHNR
jgi:hypothetical protein